MGGILAKIKDKMWKSSGQAARSEKATSPDETAQQVTAPQTHQTDPATAESTGRIVVVGKESVFSQEIIDYALEMAKRMSYEIVALNAAPLHCDTFKVLSDSFNKICDDFSALSKKNVQAFREAAAQKEIPFTHIIKFNDSYEVLKEIKNEIGAFEFVVSETEEQDDVPGPENEKGAKRKIFVYSIM